MAAIHRRSSKARTTARVINALVCAVVAIFSFRYVFSIGPVFEIIADNLFRAPWLVLHVAGAAAALLVAPLQFFPRLRGRFPLLHRVLGRVYVFGCLLGGIAGIPLALGSAAGPVAAGGFGTLAIAWLVTTALAWFAAIQRQFTDHRAWMIRSFSLTYAAVTLRVYLAVLGAMPVAFIEGYRVVSWLCWVPNLLVAELYLRARQAARAPRSQTTAPQTTASQTAATVMSA